MLTRLPSCKITGAILVALALFTIVLANAPRADADTSPADHVRDNRYLPLCSVEDASSGPVPCVWAAFAQGNDRGRSFRVFRRIDPDSGNHLWKYISDARAFELVGGCDADGPLFCRTATSRVIMLDEPTTPVGTVVENYRIVLAVRIGHGRLRFETNDGAWWRATPCQMEDSTSCWWDAERRGNRIGTPLVNMGGVILPIKVRIR